MPKNDAACFLLLMAISIRLKEKRLTNHVDNSSNLDSESVFPGENWFFYWKTSAALWESKIAGFVGVGPLFVPLYWGFHTENAETFDFGQIRPEADIARLCKVAHQLGREIVILLPLGGVPFQPNGGLPSFLARNPAQDQHGMTQAFLDRDGEVHKVHSFYDPRVYQAYRKYVWQLGQYLASKNVSVEILGIRAHWIDGLQAYSFLTDYSPAFTQGFVRFLKQQKLDLRLDEHGQEVPALPKEEEQIQATRYRKLIADLYLQTASETLNAYWVGEQDYGMLGASPTDIFPRSFDDWPMQAALLGDLLTLLDWDLLPSSAMLPHQTKKGPIEKFLKDLMTPTFVQTAMQRDVSEEASPGAFLPLVFLDFFWDDERRTAALPYLEELGLIPYAHKFFRGCWRWRTRFNFDRESEEGHSGQLKFFFAPEMDRARFQQVLRLFLNGQKIILDESKLDPVLAKKLQLFFVENDLKPQNINFLTPITMVRLGDGMLMIYDGTKLKEHHVSKKMAFWEHVTKYLNLRHMAVRGDELPYYLWKTRSTGTYELNYDEIRRVCLYNPGTERLKCQVIGPKNFAFLKVVDPSQAQAKSTTMGVDVDLLPGGSISLDFGHYEAGGQ